MVILKQTYRFLLLMFFFPVALIAQETATIHGKVVDEKGKPLSLVNVVESVKQTGVVTDDNGHYEMQVPADKEIIIYFSFIGFHKESKKLTLKAGSRNEVSIQFKKESIYFDEVEVQDVHERATNLVRIDPKTIDALPSAIGGVEGLLKTLPGVSSNNELSSQYSVRGGSFDENLVYINDIEVYRPFLVRSGKQEGLSIINSDLISSIQFSAGGFDAKYGDKMSSVLDIKYKKPNKFAGTISAGLLGEALHLEGGSKDHRLTYLFGARRKTTKYLLNTLDTKGDYLPSFNDFQTYITYDISPEWELGFLGYYGMNNFLYIPEDRETRFGTISEAYQFKVYFDGKEVDRYRTFLGGLTANYNPNKDFNIKFITSTYQSTEEETYDIEGQYWLDQVETDFGDSTFGDIAYNKGVGGYLIHSRNKLDVLVANAGFKANYNKGNHFLQWGTRYQREIINDKLNEWTMLDSAGYSIPPYNTDLIVFHDVIKSKAALSSNRYNAYLQDRWTINQNKNLFLIGGVRANYWDSNDQITVSPRASISYQPKWKNDLLFRLATGFYHQPPFYRELRALDGSINKSVKAQRSIHFVAGSDWDFVAWGRPFKYVTEIYYKKLDNLVPYEIDNLRIRYLAKNNAHGYAAGVDMRINGEFVPGIESWFSLSVMQTQQDIEDDFYIDKDNNRIEPGYIPRPTDQRVNIGIFFQDYLPRFPTYKLHLNLLFGTGLPFGPPDHELYKDTLRIPPYKRVDIGFSKLIISDKRKGAEQKKVLGYFNSIWLSLEVFNLLDISNTISYIWIKDINNVTYAVPNHLTGRQLNVRLIAKF
ncbi:MAG: TonB-dependent receptor [Bacteroidia bacterium]|nr:TonB-dependent receptor [Bacteroidia bacterium]